MDASEVVRLRNIWFNQIAIVQFHILYTVGLLQFAA